MGLFDSPSHILIVLLVLVLLFGSTRLPKMAKSLGESMRIFKKEAQKLHDSDDGQQVVQGTVQQQLPTVQQAAQQTAAQQPVQDAVQQPVQDQVGVTVQLPDGSTVTGNPVPPQTNQPG